MAFAPLFWVVFRIYVSRKNVPPTVMHLRIIKEGLLLCDKIQNFKYKHYGREQLSTSEGLFQAV